MSSQSGDQVHLRTSSFENCMDEVSRRIGQRNLLLAVSGGSDSMALARLTRQWLDRRMLVNSELGDASVGRVPHLYAVTIDHGLRLESAQECAHVKSELENKLNVPTQIVTLDWRTTERRSPEKENAVGMPRKSNLQKLARARRYQELLKEASRCKAGAVLVAHHAEDAIETFLMRFARGSGVAGWKGLQPVRVVFKSNVFEIYDDDSQLPPHILLVRPLLDWTKPALKEMCQLEPKIRWVEDPSNRNEVFDRVRIRHALSAADLVEGGFNEKIRLAEKEARAWSDALDEFCTQLLRSSSVVIHPVGVVAVDLAKLQHGVSVPAPSDDTSRVESERAGAHDELYLECLGRVFAVVGNTSLKPSSPALRRFSEWIERSKRIVTMQTGGTAKSLSTMIGRCQVTLNSEEVETPNGVKMHFMLLVMPSKNEGQGRGETGMSHDHDQDYDDGGALIANEGAADDGILTLSIPTKQERVQPALAHGMWGDRYWVRTHLPLHHKTIVIGDIKLPQILKSVKAEHERIVMEKIQGMRSEGRLRKHLKQTVRVRIRRHATNAILPEASTRGFRLEEAPIFPIGMEDDIILPVRSEFLPTHASRWIWWKSLQG